MIPKSVDVIVTRKLIYFCCLAGRLRRKKLEYNYNWRMGQPDSGIQFGWLAYKCLFILKTI